MRSLTKAFLYIWLLVSGLALAPLEAGACSCAEPPPVAEDLERKTAVFSGTVLEVDEPNNGVMRSSADLVKVLFEVEDAWKGVDATQVIVHTALSSASCGYEGFEIGKAYLVFAYGPQEQLETGLCERVIPLHSADPVMEELGEGYQPTDQVNLNLSGGGENRMITGVIAGGILLIVVLLFLGWRRLRN